MGGRGHKTHVVHDGERRRRVNLFIRQFVYQFDHQIDHPSGGRESAFTEAPRVSLELKALDATLEALHPKTRNPPSLKSIEVPLVL